MKKIILFFALIAQVLTLITCGIPNYFYLSSGYIRFESTPIDTPDSSGYEVYFQLNDSVQVSKCRNCPSVFLFYFLDSNDYYSNSSNKNTIFNKFSDNYGSVSRKGSLISIRQNEFRPLIPVIRPTDYFQDMRVSIYNLGFADRNKSVTRPTYHIPIPRDQNGLPTSDRINFRLNFEKTSRKLMLLCDYDEVSGDYLSASELCRADGSLFSDIPKDSDFSTYLNTHDDYQSVDPTYLSSIKLHIMGAVCASAGNFDNIYWSNLYDIATFDLTGAI